MSLPGNESPQAVDFLEQLAHTGDGVFAVDAQHRIVFWNPAAESLLGFPAREVLNKRCQDVIHGCDCAGTDVCGTQCVPFAEAQKLRWNPHPDLHTRTKTGEPLSLRVSSLGVLSPSGKLSALVHIFRNAHETEPPLFGPLPESAAATSSSRPDVLRENYGETEPSTLSARELAVLRLVAEGAHTKDIAARLFISPTTVRNHVENILKKLHVHSRLEAILWASHHNLL